MDNILQVLQREKGREFKQCKKYADFIVNMIEQMSVDGKLADKHRYLEFPKSHNTNCKHIVQERIKERLGIRAYVTDNLAHKLFMHPVMSARFHTDAYTGNVDVFVNMF